MKSEGANLKMVLKEFKIPFSSLSSIGSGRGSAEFIQLITYLKKPGVFAEINKVLATLDIPFTILSGIVAYKGKVGLEELITYFNKPGAFAKIKKVLETLDIPFTTLAGIVQTKGKAGLEELITYWHNDNNTLKLLIKKSGIKAGSILGLLPYACKDAVKKLQNFEKIFVEHEAELILLKTKQINVDNLLKSLCGYKPEQNLEIIKSVLTELKNNKKLPSYSGQELANWLKKVTETIISTLGFKQKSGDVPPANCDEEQGYDENDPEYEEQLKLQEGSVVTTFGKGNAKDTSFIDNNWGDYAAQEDSKMDDTFNNLKFDFIFEN